MKPEFKELIPDLYMYQVGMNNASLPIHAAQHSNCMQASMGEQTNALHPPGTGEEIWDQFLGTSGLGLLPLKTKKKTSWKPTINTLPRRVSIIIIIF